MDTHPTPPTQQVQVNKYNNWVVRNYDDLCNLYNLYCSNIDGNLNINTSIIGSPFLFDKFAKLMYSRTSNDLKKYHHI